MFVDPDEFADCDVFPVAPNIEVEIDGPQVLGHLLGPDGEPIATLFDRRVVPFGFHR